MSSQRRYRHGDGKETGAASWLWEGPAAEGDAGVLMDRFEKRIRQL